MSVISAALLVGAAVVSLAAYRIRRDRVWAILGTAFAVGLVLSFIRNGLTASVSVDIGDALVFVVGFLAAAEAFGLPRSLVIRLGIGLRSREWEFDRKLADLLRPLDPLVDGQLPDARDPAFGDWRSSVVGDGRARLAALARLTPPDDRWRALATTYATVLRARLDAIQGDSAGAVPPSIVQMTMDADTERERLREMYRADADRLYRSSFAVRLLHKRRDCRSSPPRRGSRRQSSDKDKVALVNLLPPMLLITRIGVVSASLPPPAMSGHLDQGGEPPPMLAP